MSSDNLTDRIVTKNFFLLGSGEIIARLISFLAIIYIARMLGPEAYGVIGFAMAVILYFQRITDFGIEALGPSEVAKDYDKIEESALSVLVIRLVIAAFLVGGIAGTGLFLIDQPEGTVLALYGLTLFAVGGSTRWIHLGLEKAGYVSLARIIGEVAKILLILFLVREAADILNVPIAQFIGDICAALLMLWWVRKRGYNLRLRFSWNAAKPLFKRSWPLMITPLLGLVIYNSDLIILKFFRTSSVVGYYLAAYTLITFMGNMSTTYSHSLLPTLSRLEKLENHRKELYHTAVAHVFAISLPIAVGGFLLASKIIDLGFGSHYQASGLVLKILVWSIPVLLLRTVLQTLLISCGKQILVLRLTTIVVGLNLILNFLLIPQYGMIGAAVSTVATEVVRMLLSQSYVMREGFSMTGFSRLWRTIIAATAMGFLLIILWPSSIWGALAIGILVYFATLSLIGGIRFQRGKLPSLSV